MGSLPLSNPFVVPSLGLSGGLWLGWSNLNPVTVLHASQNVIHTYIDHMNPLYRGYFTFVYAPPRIEYRIPFWNLLNTLAPPIGQKWVLLGDFNETLFQWEKFDNYCPSTQSETLFKIFIFKHNLLDSPHSGVTFT